MKKFLLLMLLVIGSVSLWGQSPQYGDATNGFDLIFDDATKTVTFKGHGNINNLSNGDEVYSYTGDAYNNVFLSNEGDWPSSTTTGAKYSPVVYTRSKKYTQIEDPTYASIRRFNVGNSVYEYKDGSYSKVEGKAKLDDTKGDNYYGTLTDGDQVADCSEFLEAMKEFGNEGYIFKKNDAGNIEFVKNGEKYSDDVEYYYSSTHFNSWEQVPEESQLEKINEENASILDSYIAEGRWKQECVGFVYVKDEYGVFQQFTSWGNSELYYPGKTYGITSSQYDTGNIVEITDENKELIKSYLITEGFKDGTNICYKEGNTYKTVKAGEACVEGREYYNGITFTPLAMSEVSTDTYTYATTSVSLNGNTYYAYVDGEYNLVNEGDEYAGDGNYYSYVGYEYTERDKEYLLEHGYIEMTQDSQFWSEIVDAINNHFGEGYITVKVVSDSESPVEVGQKSIMALLNTKARTLDLSGSTISEIISPYTTADADAVNPNGTFMKGTDGTKNTYVETLYTPVVTGNSVLPALAFDKMVALRYLNISDGIETLATKSLDGHYGNANCFTLSTLSLPNTLKYIKANACNNHYSASDHNALKNLEGESIPFLETLTFPKGLLEIETDAFQGVCPKDVYFLGVDAPRVAKYAWGNDAYISNNALSPQAASLNGVTVDQSTGYSTRMNYIAQSGWIAMLHFPAACTKEQAARYTDVTRSYYRIENYLYDNGQVPEMDKVELGEGDIYHNIDNPNILYDGTGAYYNPGKETTPLTGSGTTAEPAAQNTFYNTYDNFNTNGVGAYTGGFYDYTVGSQILWPSMVMAFRATVVAENDVLWDGVTSIGQGIVNAGGSYSGDGTEYIGLHQFVLAAADVTNDNTKEYPLDKFADGKWHTICVPFNMTKKQMKETFGASGKHESTEEEISAGNYVEQNGSYYTYEFDHLRVCKFNEVVREEDKITLKFNNEQFINATDDAIVIEAHTPYMIHAEKGELVDGSGTATAKFKGYVNVPGVASITEIVSTGDNANGIYTFAGNYNAFTTDGSDHEVYMPQYCYFFNFSAQALRFQIGTTGKWTPHAAIVRAANGVDDNATYFSDSAPSASKIRTLFFGDIDENETAIEKIAIEADGELIYTNAPVYNLSGQVVGNSLDNLAPGIYIVNGKKYMVK